MTTQTGTGSRAWVGSLAAYNAGRLIGAWIDLDGKDAEDVAEEAREAMRPMIAGFMGEAQAFDEIWIFDHEGLGGLVSGECNVVEAVRAAEVLAEVDDADAFRAYCEGLGPTNIDLDSVAEDFREAYAGEWSSMADYAEDLAEDTGSLADVPEHFRPYIDFESYGRDLVLGGDYWTADAPGGVYVFRSY